MSSRDKIKRFFYKKLGMENSRALLKELDLISIKQFRINEKRVWDILLAKNEEIKKQQFEQEIKEKEQIFDTAIKSFAKGKEPIRELADNVIDVSGLRVIRSNNPTIKNVYIDEELKDVRGSGKTKAAQH